MRAPLANAFARHGRGALVIALLSSFGLAVSACSASASLRAADKGDLAGLRTALAGERARCELEPDEIRKLAKKIAERELLGSDGETLIARIDEARGCVRPLSSVLGRLADAPGDVGASATLALLEERTGDK